MMNKVVPMIHVPEVRLTVEWYKTVGFTVTRVHEEDGEMEWALLSFGDSEVMFSEGGRVSTDFRRDVDLYIHVDDLDELYQRLKDRVEVVESLHETFYGMREFIIRDLNRFWITFGQTAASQ
jgi:uncharacterized glyoxalase superfamily protein PhnB